MEIKVNCWNLQELVFSRVFYVPVGINFDNGVLLIFFTYDDGSEGVEEVRCTYFTINISEDIYED